MTGLDDLRREIEELRARNSDLNAAILRISASLDFDTVLNQVVDSARVLTSARYGAITTVDDAGQPQDFIASGFTPEDLRKMTDWPDGPRLFEHLRDLKAPLRLTDAAVWIRSLGYSAYPIFAKTLQVTPMRHRGELLGIFVLGDKQGGVAFTDEDEEAVVLFASQAAAVIANARMYRDERRARADLEALINTAPVGVVVFDAATGHPVSFNREANRILDGLRMPDQPPEQLLEMLTCRIDDGSEIALAELPMARVLGGAETVRAEHVELSVPDGRRITVLVSATPIRSAAGAVESVVVTMQDLAPLRALERSRAEFLSMVSHELRAPLNSIKGSAASARRVTRVLDPDEARQFFRVIEEQTDRMYDLIGDLLDVGRIDAGMMSVRPEPTEVEALVDQARNTFISGGGRHTLEIDLPPDLPPVLADERRIVQVLNNLVSNAARHSPATSRVRIDAARDGIHVAISVSDEGRGVPPEVLPRLFCKYAGAGGDDAEPRGGGYGLGLAICKGLVEAHGGRIRAASGGTDHGTRFTFTLPVAGDAGKGAAPGFAPPSPRDGFGQTRVLVVDDDPETLRFVRDTLSTEGYDTLVAGDSNDLSQLIRTKRPHLVLLDLMLPGADGIELMEQVPDLADLPVIFISGYGRDETIARALEAGAADYVVKPFSPTELAARIRAALRLRAEPASFVLRELAIDYARRQARLAGRVLALTATEFELLRVLSLNAGRILTHETLMRQVWGDKHRTGHNVVRAYVKRLRRKLGDEPKRPVYIVTKYRVGYRMPAPSDPEPSDACYGRREVVVDRRV